MYNSQTIPPGGVFLVKEQGPPNASLVTYCRDRMLMSYMFMGMDRATAEGHVDKTMDSVKASDASYLGAKLLRELPPQAFSQA